MLDQILSETKPKMERQISHFEDAIRTIRAGKAETTLIEDLPVSYWGTNTSLKQIASISVPSPTLITITPFDKNSLGDIELAIRNGNLGVSPTNDGHIIRISLPPLSEERRKELCKIVHDKGEETRISIRNIRQEAWQKIQKAERVHQISEDDRYRGEEELNKTIEEMNKKIDVMAKQKESEIMRV